MTKNKHRESLIVEIDKKYKEILDNRFNPKKADDIGVIHVGCPLCADHPKCINEESKACPFKKFENKEFGVPGCTLWVAKIKALANAERSFSMGSDVVIMFYDSCKPLTTLAEERMMQFRKVAQDHIKWI